MSFIQKHKDSINIAEFAYDDRKYDVAVNRYYYSTYQKILHELNKIDKNEIDFNINSADGKDSHNNTIYLFREKVLKIRFVGKDKLKKTIEFNSKIIALKSLRHKADYKSTLLSKKEAKEARKMFSVLNKII